MNLLENIHELCIDHFVQKYLLRKLPPLLAWTEVNLVPLWRALLCPCPLPAQGVAALILTPVLPPGLQGSDNSPICSCHFQILVPLFCAATSPHTPRRSFATHAIDSSTWPEWLEVPAEVALPRSVKVLAPGSWSVPALLLHSKCLRICLMIPPGPWPLGLLHLSSRSLLRTPNQSHHRPRHNQTCAISSPLFPAARSPKPTSYSPVTPLHADASLIPQDSQPPLPDPPAVPPLFLFLLLPSPTSLDPRAHHCNHPLHTPPCFCCSSHVLPLSLNLQPSAHNLIFLCFLLKYDWHPMLP